MRSSAGKARKRAPCRPRRASWPGTGCTRHTPPRLAASQRRLRGLYIKAGHMVASHGLMVPRPYLEACEGLKGGAAAEGTGRVAAVVERELKARAGGGRSARLPGPYPGTFLESLSSHARPF